MAERLEARLNDIVLRFDGEVLEMFDLSTIGGARYLAEMLGGLKVDGDMLFITSGDTTTRPYQFKEAARSDVERIAEAVNAARG